MKIHISKPVCVCVFKITGLKGLINLWFKQTLSIDLPNIIVIIAVWELKITLALTNILYKSQLLICHNKNNRCWKIFIYKFQQPI